MKLKSIMAALFVAMVMMSGSVFAAEKINVNTASVEQLQEVKGIGEKTAEAIVVYREQHGAFKSMDDLVNVKGIGEKKLDKIDDDLVVE